MKSDHQSPNFAYLLAGSSFESAGAACIYTGFEST